MPSFDDSGRSSMVRHRKKLVCHVSSVHRPFDIRIFQKECRTLAQNGLEVGFMVQHGNDETSEGIRLVALPRVKSRIARLLVLPAMIFLNCLKLRARVYHFHDPELLPVFAFLKMFTGSKVIYDVHEDYPKAVLQKPYIPKPFRGFCSITVDYGEKFLARLLDGVVTATDDLRARFSFHNKVISLRNYPIIAAFQHGNGRSHNPKIACNLVYNGGLTHENGITRIVEALSQISSSKSVRLTLCGSFSSQRYEEEIRKLQGFEYVAYKGWLDSKLMPNLLGQSDIGMICYAPDPNHLLAMPNKLFEFMAAGLPIIASDFPLWTELVADNQCGICVDPTDPDQIAKAIEHLADNPVLRKRLGRNGAALAAKDFNWEKESQKLTCMYKSLLS